ncbi:helix-turn-helix domain-containing protein [Shimazuella alba]|uniref:Helix-turn-helix domain-containing protein n=1 Tax=Shimazuella alba TaxID=2690964 RepID=A0A6I4VWL9_9BACL|nr:helix-turn-helix domain-containing protein [Shimazuella alba]MXQ55313.1 helix-turn-helix domain-containing protein [Shimazuella alba]
MYLEQEKSYRAVANELGIRKESQVKDWMKKYQNKESFVDKRGGFPKRATHSWVDRVQFKG